MIRHDYPNLHKWLLHLYWDESPEETRGAFKSTTHFRDVCIPITCTCDRLPTDVLVSCRSKAGMRWQAKFTLCPWDLYQISCREVVLEGRWLFSGRECITSSVLRTLVSSFHVSYILTCLCFRQSTFMANGRRCLKRLCDTYQVHPPIFANELRSALDPLARLVILTLPKFQDREARFVLWLHARKPPSHRILYALLILTVNTSADANIDWSLCSLALVRGCASDLVINSILHTDPTFNVY